MAFDLKETSQRIKNSGYGLLFSLENKNFSTTSAPGNIEVNRQIEGIDGGFLLQLKAKSIGKKEIKALSFVISDFILPKEFEPGKVLEHGWLQCSEVGYKTLDEPTPQKFVFLRRDQNPFSFKNEYGYLPGAVISEWFTIMRFGEKSFLIGAVTTKNQFSQIYMRKGETGVEVRVTTQLDEITLPTDKFLESEKIVYLFGEEEEIKRKFANIIKKEMGVKDTRQPIKAMCCSYYWNGNKVTEEIINNELYAISSLPKKLKLDYIQIDAGYTKHFGDWMNYKERFPNGLSGAVKNIKALGFKAGIWISPFAINPNTETFKKHPNWFLKDQNGNSFDARFTSPFDSLIPDIDLEALDPTKEEVQDYLKEIFGHFRKIGFELYKLDFMYPVCLSNKYEKELTRAQAIRGALELIRRVVGEDAHIVSAITPISPTIGLVDSARLGLDTLNPFVCMVPFLDKSINNFMLRSDLKENKERLFTNGILWVQDPDVLVFRKGTGIDEELIKEHKEFALKNKMSLWIGDSLYKMEMKERLEVMKFFNDD